jgi:hypothetical protein
LVTAGEIVRRARKEAKRTGRSEIDVIRERSQEAVRKEEQSKAPKPSKKKFDGPKHTGVGSGKFKQPISSSKQTTISKDSQGFERKQLKVSYSLGKPAEGSQADQIIKRGGSVRLQKGPRFGGVGVREPTIDRPTAPTSTISPAREVSPLRKATGRIETGLSRAVSRNQASSFGELRAGLASSIPILAIRPHNPTLSPRENKLRRAENRRLLRQQQKDLISVEESASRTKSGKKLTSFLEKKQEESFTDFTGAISTFPIVFSKKSVGVSDKGVNPIKGNKASNRQRKHLSLNITNNGHKNNKIEDPLPQLTSKSIPPRSHATKEGSLVNKGIAITTSVGKTTLSGAKALSTSLALGTVKRPVSTVGSFFLIGKGAAVVGRGSAGITRLLKGSTKLQAGAARIGSTGTIGAVVGRDIVRQPTPQGKALATIGGAGILVGAKVGGRALRTTRNVGRRVGSEMVPPERVFDVKVLEGKSTFPTTRSVEQSLAEFRRPRTPEGEVLVAHAAPQKLKGAEIGAGPAGARNLEDAGLFVTPFGKASPHFLQVGTKGQSPDIQFKALPEFTGPNLVRVRVKEVKRQPTKVLKTPGFSQVNTFLETQAGKGTAFITKRSEVGQGKIRDPLASGTSELEAIIPKGSKLKKVKTKRQVTKFKGEVIPIKDFKLVENVKVPGKVSAKQFGKIKKSSSSLSSLGKTKVRISRTGSALASSRAVSSSKISSAVGSSASSRPKGSSRGRSSSKRGSSSSSRSVLGSSGSTSSAISRSLYSKPSSPSRPSKSSSIRPLRPINSRSPRPVKVPEFKFRAQKAKKSPTHHKISRELRYQPSLVGVAFKIKRQKKKFLTGIGVRGI